MRRLAILRPEPGASATVERAEAIGIDAFAIPLFEIEALDWEVPDASRFDGLLLTSANAVRHGGPRLGQLRQLPAYAVGEATAGAALDAGFAVAASGDGGVDQLLASVPADLRLLHVCGEHRISPEVERRITALPVYRSNELPPPDGIAAIEGETVAVHSPRAGRRLAELAQRLGIDRGTVRIAAISEAAAAAAGDGWERLETAATPSETALLAVAAQLCDNRREI